MIHQFTVTFAPAEELAALPAAEIYMSSLHGWLFNALLRDANPAEADWLHKHQAPKPFSLVPRLGPEGELIGIRLVVWAERAAETLAKAWRSVVAAETVYQLGRHTFTVTEAIQSEPVDFLYLLNKSRPNSRLRLRFLTPTAFKQGPLRLHLPLPGNVFERPFALWQTVAPTSVRLPATWLEWCTQKVMAQELTIQTKQTALNKQAKFTGFTGFVSFRAKSDERESLRIWQALGRLASYCGVGYKTTMGMGAVAYLPNRRRKKTNRSR